MKFHGSQESREAEGRRASGLENEEEKNVSNGKESKRKVIRYKALKKWANKMQKVRGVSQRSAKGLKKTKYLKYDITDQSMASEDSSAIQG